MNVIYNYERYWFLPNICQVDSQLAFKFFNKMEDLKFGLKTFEMITTKLQVTPVVEYKVFLPFSSECLKATYTLQRGLQPLVCFTFQDGVGFWIFLYT